MMPPNVKSHRKPGKGLGRAAGAISGSVTHTQSEHAEKQDWYLAQANRGQLLLGEGQTEQAREVFEATLAGLGEEPSYSRAVIMERLGRCFLMGGMPLQAADFFQQSMEVTDKLANSRGVRALQGVLQSGLGDAFRASGHLGEARKSYEAALEIGSGLEDKPAQGVDLDHLGSLALDEGRLDEAISRFEAALRIFEDIGERAMEAVALNHLGMAFEQAQEWDEAERHSIAAARVMETCGNLAGVAECRSQVAVIMEKSGRSDDAEDWYRKALDVARQSANTVEMRRQLINLARFLHGRPDRLAEAQQLVEAALASAGISLDADVWAAYGLLADILDKEAANAVERAARAAIEAQVRNYRHIRQYGPRLLGTLARLGEEPSFGRAVLMERLGRCCLAGGRPQPASLLFQNAMETLERIAPNDSVRALRGVLRSGLGDAFRVAGHNADAQAAYEAALAIAEELSDLRAQAIHLDHLGTLALADGRLTEALAHFQTALELFRQLRERSPEAAACQHLGMALERAEQWEEAGRHYHEAVRIREELGDVAGSDRARALSAKLGEKRGPVEVSRAVAAPIEAAAEGEADVTAPAAVFGLTIHEELTTDCVFDSDLLIDVGRHSRILPWAGDPDSLPGDAIPILVPRVRTCADEAGCLRIYLPPGEPVLQQLSDCVVMRKSVREIAVSGNPDVVWSLIRRMDGSRTVREILSAIPGDAREAAARLLAALAANGAIDVSGRPIGRFLHAATKKGVLEGGGLESDDVLRLATDGDYRAYSGASQIALDGAVPDRLRAFHALTRARRSRRDYAGTAITREEFDSLLHTACGVTGTMPWGGRELKLRAYPSSGALYAVEIYPVVLRVDGLEPGVYHYKAGEHMLDVVGPDLSSDRFVAAMLPVERQMVSGAAAMFCLVGRFKRHERKYGQGGYRMLVAEAGHISQNLVLAAVALGMSARPFGGVFDGLINEHLGLDEAEEQFLLSVLVGQAGSGNTEKPGETT